MSHKRDLGAKPPAAGGYGSLEAKHPVAGRFFGKNGYFNAIWITFRAFLETFERTKFLRFESQLSKSLSLLQFKFKNTFKIVHFGVKFCDLAWSGESRYIAFCSIFSIKSFTRIFADFCFVMKLTSFRNMYDQEPKHL